MIGKLSTCNCVIDVDMINHEAAFVSACSDHARLEYTASEVMAEHIAIQIDAIKHNPVKRLKRWWHT